MVYERERTREPEAGAEDAYDRSLRLWKEKRDRDLNGDIIIKGDSTPPVQTQFALMGQMLPKLNTPLQEWNLWRIVVPTQTGKQAQQGGLAFFIEQGKGHSVLNNERVDWKKGDLVVIPIRENEVEFQHFNDDPDSPSVCYMFRHRFFKEEIGSITRHIEDSPDWKASAS